MGGPQSQVQRAVARAGAVARVASRSPRVVAIGIASVHGGCAASRAVQVSRGGSGCRVGCRALEYV